MNENYVQEISVKEFSIICRICFERNDLTQFKQNLLELYTKLLMGSEVFNSLSIIPYMN